MEQACGLKGGCRNDHLHEIRHLAFVNLFAGVLTGDADHDDEVVRGDDDSILAEVAFQPEAATGFRLLRRKSRRSTARFPVLTSVLGPRLSGASHSKLQP
jgi:hypothetical protein